MISLNITSGDSLYHKNYRHLSIPPKLIVIVTEIRFLTTVYMYSISKKKLRMTIKHAGEGISRAICQRHQ